jgi:hypothetical protein
MGDEMRHTQGGNNNAYCQDNETCWLDWTRLQKHADVHRFLKLLTERRLLRGTEHERLRTSPNRLIREATKAWHGARLNQPDWSAHSRSVPFTAEIRREKLRFHLKDHHQPTNMMIVTTTQLFKVAYGEFAIGAYNLNNAEQTMGLFRGCLASQAPFIIQIPFRRRAPMSGLIRSCSGSTPKVSQPGSRAIQPTASAGRASAGATRNTPGPGINARSSAGGSHELPASSGCSMPHAWITSSASPAFGPSRLPPVPPDAVVGSERPGVNC